MTSWRERLCGTVALRPASDDDSLQDLAQVLKANPHFSHGGGFLLNKNPAHLKTARSVILPTEKYAVMILKTDGHAVIYSEDEAIAGAGEDLNDDEAILPHNVKD